MAKGILIALEGIDGAGTTTQARRVVAALRKDSIGAVSVAAPSSGAVGKLIRLYLGGGLPAPNMDVRGQVMPMLFIADLLLLQSSEIIPRLKEFDVVVCDRHILSTYAYQTNGLDKRQWIAQLANAVRQPDLSIILEIDVDVAMKRVRDRGKRLEIYEARDRQVAAARNYKELSQSFPGQLVQVVDGSESAENVTQQIVKLITNKRC